MAWRNESQTGKLMRESSHFAVRPVQNCWVGPQRHLRHDSGGDGDTLATAKKPRFVLFMILFGPNSRSF
jgi:hypothetical protein